MHRFSRFKSWALSIEVLFQFHFWMIWLWMLLIWPTVLWWHDSLPFLAFASIWANLATHWGAWQAARTELRLLNGVAPPLSCPKR